jgi:hypothetical protein
VGSVLVGIGSRLERLGGGEEVYWKPCFRISHGWQRKQGKKTERKRGRLVGKHLVNRLVLVSEEAG